MAAYGAIFTLNLCYLAALRALLVGRQYSVPILEDLPALAAGLVPLGVLWMGALGGVTASLYGVFEHMNDWDTEYRFWHIARPLVGAILATVAFLIFVGLLNGLFVMKRGVARV